MLKTIYSILIEKKKKKRGEFEISSLFDLLLFYLKIVRIECEPVKNGKFIKYCFWRGLISRRYLNGPSMLSLGTCKQSRL